MSLARRLMPSLSELIAFEAAARHGNFTRAAEELALTQSAVSKQLRELEETLGVELFVRVNRRVILTDVGRRYLAEIRSSLMKLEQATHGAIAAGGSTAVIDLAVLPTFATRWLIPRLPRFLDRHSGVTINFATRLAPFDFDEQPFDAAIHFGYGNWPGTVARHLCDEHVIPVASPAYTNAIGIRAPEDLIRARLLQQVTRPNLWHDWFQAAGVAVETPYRGPLFDQFAMMARAAGAGLGAALVPRFLVEEELRSGSLTPLFNLSVQGDRGYYLVVPARKHDSSLIAAFGDWLVAEAQSIRL